MKYKVFMQMSKTHFKFAEHLWYRVLMVGEVAGIHWGSRIVAACGLYTLPATAGAWIHASLPVKRENWWIWNGFSSSFFLCYRWISPSPAKPNNQHKQSVLVFIFLSLLRLLSSGLAIVHCYHGRRRTWSLGVAVRFEILTTAMWLDRGCFSWWLANGRGDNSVRVGGRCGSAWFTIMGTGLGQPVYTVSLVSSPFSFLFLFLFFIDLPLPFGISVHSFYEWKQSPIF